MQTSKHSLPLHLAIEQISRDEDRLIHQLTVSTGGRPLILVDIESDVFEWPRIYSYFIDRLNVPWRLRDTFVFKVFNLLTGIMCEYDGDRAHFPINDGARWIETQFLTAEAERLVAAFSRCASDE